MSPIAKPQFYAEPSFDEAWEARAFDDEEELDDDDLEDYDDDEECFELDFD